MLWSAYLTLCATDHITYYQWLEASVIDISGNIESLKRSTINEIKELYDIPGSRSEFLPKDLAEKMAELSVRMNREIAVYIDRKGNIIDVSVGDSSTVSLSEFKGKKDKSRLSGIRCVHTHPNGDGMLSAVDINSLLTLRLDAMTSIGVDESGITEIYTAVPVRDINGEFTTSDIWGPFGLGDEEQDRIFDYIAEADRNGIVSTEKNEDEEECALLVGLETTSGTIINGKTEGERLLEELEELASTAGVKVLKKVLQKRQSKDSAYYVGKGMVEQLNLVRQALGANLLIFDDELSGAQVRNIEEATGIKVIDRATLILDIFAQRARSKEGKLQVELAQLKYRLPRLIGLGNQLSRLGGGIGTRGPGEKKLEVDRRHIKRRISYLESELKDLNKRRSLMREGRQKNDIPTVALVGYTNVGKSTLLNKLCSSDVIAENKLFATLDPSVRSMKLPDGRDILFIDTVGFIRKLPHDLIEAFKSTLEEAVFADVLLHVADVSSDEAEIQIQVVNQILQGLGALNKSIILVLNKHDLRRNSESRISVSQYGMKSFEISAVTGFGLDELIDGIMGIIPSDEVGVEILAPYSEGWVLPYIHENGKVIEEAYTEEGSLIKAKVKIAKLGAIKKYIK